MAQIKAKAKWQIITVRVVGVLASIALAVLIAWLTLHDLTLDAAAIGWRRFFISPGMAGLAAVIAATIAALTVGRQLRQSRTAESRKAWWQTFEWVTDRVLPRDGEAVFDKAWGVSLLGKLGDDKSADENQEKARASTVAHLVTKMNLEEQRLAAELDTATTYQSLDIHSATPSELAGSLTEENSTTSIGRSGRNTSEEQLTDLRAKNLDAVTRYNQANRGTDGMSVEAEAYEIKNRAMDAVDRIKRDAAWGFRSTPQVGSSRFDSLLRKDGTAVAIEIIQVRDQTSIAKRLERLQRITRDLGVGLVLIVAHASSEHSIGALSLDDSTQVVVVSDFGPIDRARIKHAIDSSWSVQKATH